MKNKKAAIITITAISVLAIGLLVYAFMPLNSDREIKPESISGVDYDHTVQTIDGQKYIVPNF